MTAVLDTHVYPLPALAPAPVDDAAARRTMREQVARLEGELSELLVSAWPRPGFDPRLGESGRAPRVLTLDELEALRDRLADRVRDARRTLERRAVAEEGARCLREEMLLDPGSHRWTRVTNEDVGDPGCHDWHVRPRFGLLGMLVRWWRVVVSSGCP